MTWILIVLFMNEPYHLDTVSGFKSAKECTELAEDMFKTKPMRYWCREVKR